MSSHTRTINGLLFTSILLFFLSCERDWTINTLGWIPDELEAKSINNRGDTLELKWKTFRGGYIDYRIQRTIINEDHIKDTTTFHITKESEGLIVTWYDHDNMDLQGASYEYIIKACIGDDCSEGSESLRVALPRIEDYWFKLKEEDMEVIMRVAKGSSATNEIGFIFLKIKDQYTPNDFFDGDDIGVFSQTFEANDEDTLSLYYHFNDNGWDSGSHYYIRLFAGNDAGRWFARTKGIQVPS